MEFTTIEGAIMIKQAQLIKDVKDNLLCSLAGLQDIIETQVHGLSPLQLAIYFKKCETGVKALFANILKDANYEFVKWAETHPSIKTLDMDDAKLTSTSPPRKYMYSEATQEMEEELKARKKEEETAGVAVLLPIDENKVYQIFKIKLAGEE